MAQIKIHNGGYYEQAQTSTLAVKSSSVKSDEIFTF